MKMSSSNHHATCRSKRPWNTSRTTNWSKSRRPKFACEKCCSKRPNGDAVADGSPACKVPSQVPLLRRTRDWEVPSNQRMTSSTRLSRCTRFFENLPSHQKPSTGKASAAKLQKESQPAGSPMPAAPENLGDGSITAKPNLLAARFRPNHHCPARYRPAGAFFFYLLQEFCHGRHHRRSSLRHSARHNGRNAGI